MPPHRPPQLLKLACLVQGGVCLGVPLLPLPRPQALSDGSSVCP